MKRSLIYLSLIAFFFIASSQNKDCPPVSELKFFYENDKSFRKNIDQMLSGVQPLKDGSPNPWRGKN